MPAPVLNQILSEDNGAAAFADAPSGMVTFLFSDIEGNTRLWEEQPDTMQSALARHDALMQAAIESRGGVVFKTVGDAFHAVFEHPEAALNAALAAQTSLHMESWNLKNGRTLRVRMALHTGRAERRGGDYFGAALSRAARLLAAGHGGQTLISEAAAVSVSEGLPEGCLLRSLGRHRLKDLAQPQEIFQVLAPLLPGIMFIINGGTARREKD
ncbi:MAG: adenylate/guanylate cyclase domain-containing protein [Janthinobacterium lividum]